MFAYVRKNTPDPPKATETTKNFTANMGETEIKRTGFFGSQWTQWSGYFLT